MTVKLLNALDRVAPAKLNEQPRPTGPVYYQGVRMFLTALFCELIFADPLESGRKTMPVMQQ